MHLNNQFSPGTQEHPRATGKWTLKGFPHKGWVCTDVEDLGEPAATCEMCEVMVIRYVHTMTHPEIEDPVRAGCVCAGWMEGDIAMARKREGEVKSRSAFALRKWRRNGLGGFHLPVRGRGVSVATIPYGKNWKVAIKGNGKVQYGSKLYPTEHTARLGAFDAVMLS